MINFVASDELKVSNNININNNKNNNSNNNNHWETDGVSGSHSNDSGGSGFTYDIRSVYI